MLSKKTKYGIKALTYIARSEGDSPVQVSEIAKSEHLETYCKYISQIGNENSKKWIAENESQLNEFDKWLKTN